MLLVASLAFYAAGGSALVILLLIRIVVDYVVGRIVARDRILGMDSLVRSGVVLSFAVDQLNAIGSSLGLGTIAWTSSASGHQG